MTKSASSSCVVVYAFISAPGCRAIYGVPGVTYINCRSASTTQEMSGGDPLVHRSDTAAVYEGNSPDFHRLHARDIQAFVTAPAIDLRCVRLAPDIVAQDS